MTGRLPLAALLTAAVASAFSQPQQGVTHVTAYGVRIDALVTEGGQPVLGLRADDFEVFDAGVRQRVDDAKTASHVAVVMVLDTSLSVRGPGFGTVVSACDALVGTLTPQDRAALVIFSDRVTSVVSPTPDVGALHLALAAAKHFGAGEVSASTVWDAVFGAASLVARDPGRPLIVLFSDGMDNASWLSKAQVSHALAVLGIGVDFVRAPFDRASNDKYGPGLQSPEDLPQSTDGLIYAASDARLAQKFSARLAQLRQAYVLTYEPRDVRSDDGWHELQIRVRGRNAKVRARPGYFANRAR